MLIGTTVYEGLSLNPQHGGRLYYCTSGETSGSVGALSTDGADHRVLFTIAGAKPRAIVIDTANR